MVYRNCVGFSSFRAASFWADDGRTMDRSVMDEWAYQQQLEEQEQMSLYQKLETIKKELNAPKNQINKLGGYNYRSCEDILMAVKPLLGDLVITVTDDIELIGDRYYIRATARITDGKDCITTTAYAREPLDKKGSDASQITGAASSYARKYAL